MTNARTWKGVRFKDSVKASGLATASGDGRGDMRDKKDVRIAKLAEVCEQDRVELNSLADWCEKAADGRCCNSCDATWRHRSDTLRRIAAQGENDE